MKGVQEEVGWSGALKCRQTGGESCGATVFSEAEHREWRRPGERGEQVSASMVCFWK